ARQARQNSQSMQVQSEVLKNITSASTFVGYDTALIGGETAESISFTL
ncbi:hypothetical protein GZ118_12195, partial [Staphylococcus aureus]|nr:hypothetical protein [Staphylococcus aureus]